MAEAPPLRFDEHNVLRIGKTRKTRVTLDTLVAAFQGGESPEEIARNYDAVRLQDIGLSGINDPDLLAWTAREQRVVLTHDVTTLRQVRLLPLR